LQQWVNNCRKHVRSGSYAPRTSSTYESWTSRRSEGRLRSRPQQSTWCNIHPSPVKRIRTFTSKRSFNYARLSTWTGWLKTKCGQGFFHSNYSGRLCNGSTLNRRRRCKIGTRWWRPSWRTTTRRVKLNACIIRLPLLLNILRRLSRRHSSASTSTLGRFHITSSWRKTSSKSSIKESPWRQGR
jgi:hypothetical protein